MIRFAFKKGLRFIEPEGRAWTLLKRLPTGNIQLEDDHGEVRSLGMSKLHQDWSSGKLIVDESSLGAASNVFYLATPRDIQTYDERNQGLARLRYEVLSRIANCEATFVSSPAKLQPRLEEIARELRLEKSPAPSTVYRWWRKFRATKCITKLTDGRLNSGRKANHLAYSLFEETLYEVYLTQQRGQGKEVVESLQTKIGRANANLPPGSQIKMPGTATVYRWLQGLQQDLVARQRMGRDAARNEFRTTLKRLKVSRVLERIEIDHTPLDLIVIDKRTKLPLGRPWLTLAIDRYSRMVMGFYISFHAPSSFSILQCLKHAILPKDAWLQRFPSIKEAWPARGIPELIACDNGMDLHSDAFEDICQEIGMQILYTPAGHPYLKGAIERMFRTLNDGLIHRLPGTVFSNVDDRGDYPSEAVAAIDLETLLELLTKWIVEVYHRTPHRGLGMAPLAKWSEAETHTVIELPAYPEQLNVLVGIPATRTLFHYGVEVDCLRYNSTQLQLIGSREGGTPEIRLKFYEDDVGYIHAFDSLKKEYIRVPVVDETYAHGVSRYMHVLIREHAKKTYGPQWTHAELLQSKAAIQAIVAAAIRDKKMANRKKAAIVLSHDSVAAPGKDNLLDRAQRPVPERAAAMDKLDPGLDDELPSLPVTILKGK